MKILYENMNMNVMIFFRRIKEVIEYIIKFI